MADGAFPRSGDRENYHDDVEAQLFGEKRNYLTTEKNEYQKCYYRC